MQIIRIQIEDMLYYYHSQCLDIQKCIIVNEKNTEWNKQGYPGYAPYSIIPVTQNEVPTGEVCEGCKTAVSLDIGEKNMRQKEGTVYKWIAGDIYWIHAYGYPPVGLLPVEALSLLQDMKEKETLLQQKAKAMKEREKNKQ